MILADAQENAATADEADASFPGARARPVRRQDSQRRCIVARASMSPELLIRFVLSPQGVVTPDLKAKLPGRGVWVSARADFVSLAVKKDLFSRAFKAKAVAPEDLAGHIESLLERDCLQFLSLANKAGLAVAGFGKVESALARAEARALIHAREAGADGRRKIAQARAREGANGGASEGAAPQMIESFSSRQLDLALGRTNVIHAALKQGPAVEAFLTRCGRLRNYRGEHADAPARPHSSQSADKSAQDE